MPKSELIELTEAYKNGFITKSEYKELFGYEFLFSGLRITDLKNTDSIIRETIILAMECRQIEVIISQPKPRFKKGGVLIGTKNEAVILPNINIK
jgi:hypothetical protein